LGLKSRWLFGRIRPGANPVIIETSNLMCNRDYIKVFTIILWVWWDFVEIF